MKRIVTGVLAVLALLPFTLDAQGGYSGKYKFDSGVVVFTSESPHEKFNGTGGRDMKGFVDFNKKTFKVVVGTEDFSTGQRMRDEHMHENYLETEDYPEATYEGRLISINPATGATVTEGAMTIHGVTHKKKRTTGFLKVNGNKLTGNFNFSVLLSDYNIEIPQLLIMKLNNKIDVNVKFTLKK